MKLSSGLRPRLKVVALAVLMPLITVACTSTGNSFNTQARSQLVIGETTLEQAVAILGADPVNTYRQLDGSATSIWSRKNSMLTDAIYLNQELWLAFGPNGRFTRIVKTHNLPISQQADTPAVRETQPVTLNAPAQPVPASAANTVQPPLCPVENTRYTGTTSGYCAVPDTLSAVAPVAKTPADLSPKQTELHQPAVSFPVNSGL